MKKILILGLLIGVAAFASDLTSAKNLYEQKRYEESYQAFKTIFQGNMGHAETNLYLGRAALQTRRFNESIAAYERVLMIQPKNGVARFELGRAYHAAGLYDQAEAEFEQVLALPIPQEIRQSVLQALAAIAQMRQKHTVSLFVSAGLMDDSNIRYDSSNQLGGAGLPSVSGRAHFEQLSFTHIYNRPQKDRFWQSRVGLYHQSYFSTGRVGLETPRLLGGSVYDIAYPTFETGWLTKERDYTLFVPIGYGMLQYGGVSYFRDWSLGAQYEKPLSADRVLAVDAKLIDRTYLPLAADGKDALVLDLKASLREAGEAGLWIYRGGLKHEDTKAGGAADTTTLQLGAQHIMPLESGWSATFGGDLRYRSDSEELAAGKKRADLGLDLTAAINLPLDRHSYMALGGTYAKGNSNVDDFDYNKRVFTLSYNRFFGDSAFKRIKE